MVLANVSPARAAEAVCPCYNAQMIDAALVSLNVTDLSVGPNECEEDGTQQADISVLLDFIATEDDRDRLLVLTHVKNPRGEIGCKLEVTRFTEGTEFLSEEDGITLGQVFACRREILQSLTWLSFCAPLCSISDPEFGNCSSQ